MNWLIFPFEKEDARKVLILLCFFSTTIGISQAQNEYINPEGRNNFEVFANDEDGVYVKNTRNQETHISIYAVGNWTYHPGYNFGPGGGSKHDPYLCYPMKISALIVRRASSQYQLIGSSGSIILKPKETVSFLMNDAPGTYANNSGSVRVEIQYQPELIEVDVKEEKTDDVAEIEVQPDKDDSPVLPSPEEKNTTRVLDVTHQIFLNESLIELEIWDDKKEDGDIISLYLNDEKLLGNHSLKNEKKRISVNVSKGSSFLFMQAENLGAIPPNTAALRILSKTVDKTVILHSDMGKSGGIELIVP